MKNLLKWQAISLISRLVAMAVGLFQTFFIIRLLTPSDWGIVQIGMAIGGAFGIYQHLGLSSGSTREISTAKDDTDIFKIFITSVVIRYLVTIPISIFLYFSAESLAIGQYNQPSLVLPVKIYALVLLIQGIKGLMNSVVSGTKRFKYLFLFQSGIAVVSVLLYIPFVYSYGILGFFYAFLLFEFISTIVLGIIAFKPLKGKLAFPSKEDFVRLFKQLFSILFAIYIVKILVTQWEKSGTLLLGRDVSPSEVAIFSFALLFAKKLMHISDAVTDVNLPVLSDTFATNLDEFKELFSTNLNKIFAFMVLSAFSAVYWSNELVFFFVGNNPTYKQSLPLILPLIFAFIFYGLSDIIKSSVFIPAKYIKELLVGYFSLFVFTILGYFLLQSVLLLTPILAMTYSILLGSLAGCIFLVFTSQKRLGFTYITHDHVLLLIQAFVIMLVRNIDVFFVKVPIYLLFLGLYIWGLYIAKFITKHDINVILVRLKLSKKK